MLLDNQTAIVYGAGGAIGSAVAREDANIATFAASGWARTITASEINLTGGVVVD